MPESPLSQRRAFVLSSAGFVLISLVLLLAALVLLFKPQFGWLVGRWFLPANSTMIMVGGLLIAIAGWLLPRGTSRWIGFLLYGLVALTSPLFGYLFLAPFGVLALTWPLMLAAILRLGRAAR